MTDTHHIKILPDSTEHYIPRIVSQEVFSHRHGIYKSWPDLEINLLEDNGIVRIKRHKKDPNNAVYINFKIVESSGYQNSAILKISENALHSILGENHYALWNALSTSPEKRIWIIEAAFVLAFENISKTVGFDFKFQDISTKPNKNLKNNKWIEVDLELQVKDQQNHYVQFFAEYEFVKEQYTKQNYARKNNELKNFDLLSWINIPLPIIIGKSFIAINTLKIVEKGDLLIISKSGFNSGRLILITNSKQQFSCLFDYDSSGGPMPIEIEDNIEELETIQNENSQENTTSEDVLEEDIASEKIGALKEPIDKVDIADISIELTFQLGRLNLPLSKVSEIAPGQGFLLDASLDDPVEILANGQRIGRGELVKVDQTLGVEITDWYTNV